MAAYASTWYAGPGTKCSPQGTEGGGHGQVQVGAIKNRHVHQLIKPSLVNESCRDRIHKSLAGPAYQIVDEILEQARADR